MSRMSNAGVVHGPGLSLLLGALFIAAGSAACSKNSSTDAMPSTAAAPATLPGALGPSTEVVNQVVGQVPGLTSTQAVQGMGSVLGYAKETLPSDQYSKIASSIPGSDALIAEAAKLGKSTIPGIGGLKDTIKKAGISEQQYSQLVSSLSGMVGSKVNPEAGQALAAALQ